MCAPVSVRLSPVEEQVAIKDISDPCFSCSLFAGLAGLLWIESEGDGSIDE